MVKRCAYGLCDSDSRYGPSAKRPRPDMEGVIFYPIPRGKADQDKRREWIKNCGLEGFVSKNAGRGHYVCSKHFLEGKPTTLYPNPIPCDASQSQMDAFLRKKGRKGPTRQKFVPGKKTVFPKAPDSTPVVDIAEHGSNDVTDVTVDNNPGTSASDMEEDILETELPQVPPSPTLETIPQLPPPFAIDIPANTKEHLNATKSVTDSSTQTTIKFEDIKEYSDAELTNKSAMKRWHVKQDVLKSDDSCQFYTGLTFLKLMYVFSFIKEKAKDLQLWRGFKASKKEKQFTRGRILGIWEELIICLIRLRRGLQLKHLGDMFGVSTTLVGRICLSYTQFLREEMEFVIRWPSREQIHQNPPPSFKYFPRTRAVIDCTEFFIQRPSLPSSQRKTWSSYKHHNTFKLLVATTPRGTFSFVSDLWTGNVSDRRITQLSGFLDNVEFNDDIMADRGFIIRDLLALKGATLNMPPFAHGRQLSAAATTKTRRIARARIHVEMSIGRLKRFHILNQVIPLSLKGQMNDIVKLCAILCNLDTVLVRTR